MVKGISRQVIVVHAPDQKLFDQAIFILKDEVVGKEGITDEMLLRAADKLIRNPGKSNKPGLLCYGSFWACAGALAIGLVWLLSALI